MLLGYVLIASLKLEIIVETRWKVVFGNVPSLEKRIKEAALLVAFGNMFLEFSQLQRIELGKRCVIYKVLLAWMN